MCVGGLDELPISLRQPVILLCRYKITLRTIKAGLTKPQLLLGSAATWPRLFVFLFTCPFFAFFGLYLSTVFFVFSCHEPFTCIALYRGSRRAGQPADIQMQIFFSFLLFHTSLIFTHRVSLLFSFLPRLPMSRFIFTEYPKYSFPSFLCVGCIRALFLVSSVFPGHHFPFCLSPALPSLKYPTQENSNVFT